MANTRFPLFSADDGSLFYFHLAKSLQHHPKSSKKKGFFSMFFSTFINQQNKLLTEDHL